MLSRSSARVSWAAILPYQALSGVAVAPCTTTEASTTTPTVASSNSEPGTAACTANKASNSEFRPLGPNQETNPWAGKLILALESTIPRAAGRMAKITNAANASDGPRSTEPMMPDRTTPNKTKANSMAISEITSPNSRKKSHND